MEIISIFNKILFLHHACLAVKESHVLSINNWDINSLQVNEVVEHVHVANVLGIAPSRPPVQEGFGLLGTAFCYWQFDIDLPVFTIEFVFITLYCIQMVTTR